MGFLSAYSSTTKLIIGDKGRGYWIEIKDCLNQGDKENAERSLTSGSFKPGEDVEMSMDVARYRQLMVLASIVNWNLDDDTGKTWPIDLPHVQMLPGNEFDRIWGVVDQANKPASTEDHKTFRQDGGGRNATRGRGAA